jgi:nicotinamidase-related amidase
MIPQRKQRTYCLRKEEMPVIHVQHLALQELSFTNTEGAEIHKSMTPLKTRKVITKNFPNSFRDRIIRLLEGKYISKLVICGMMTDVCVASTSSYGLWF